MAHAESLREPYTPGMWQQPREPRCQGERGAAWGEKRAPQVEGAGAMERAPLGEERRAACG